MSAAWYGIPVLPWSRMRKIAASASGGSDPQVPGNGLRCPRPKVVRRESAKGVSAGGGWVLEVVVVVVMWIWLFGSGLLRVPGGL